MSDVVAQYRRALEALEPAIRAVPANRWEAPSPCEGWRAIDVLGHLIWVQWLAQAWAEGRDPAPQPSPPGALACANPVASWMATRDATLAAMTPAALDRTMTTRYFGEVRVADLIQRLSVFDLVVHAWDIARATGQEVRLDSDLVRVYFAGAQANEAIMRGSGQFGPACVAPPGAGEQDRFMAFLGRAV